MESLQSLNGLQAQFGTAKVGGVVRQDQIFDHKETTAFIWGYTDTQEAIRRLYERGKSSQWNGSTDLDWNTSVDLEQELFTPDASLVDEPWFKKMTPRERNRLVIESNTQTLSQFLHGEQGALIATSQLVSAVPHIDSKFYAATQVMDEARHVEVFERYVREKMPGMYPITENLFSLLQAITSESRWDFKFLGMQLLVEGLALAAFMNMINRCNEPLLKKLLRMVMQDEARHVAYGVLSLRNYYQDMRPEDRKERQEFVYESTVLMRDRLFSTQALERVGIDKSVAEGYLANSPVVKQFRSLMFVNVVPNMKKIGLLPGFLEQKFAEMGILQLQDFDTDGMLHSYIYGKDSLQGEQEQAPPRQS
ncbi:MAG TPA: ferritin-like domain-containing protein [bacterium]|nr:ferritin-like domain-containing protein [bacterium]